MLKGIIISIICGFVLFSNQTSAKKYKILFDKDCTHYQAIQILRKMEIPYNVVEVKIKDGKISCMLDNYPTCDQISRVLEESKTLVGYQLILYSRRNQEWIEATKAEQKENDKKAEEKIDNFFKNYQLVFNYKIGADPKLESGLIKKIFNIERVSFQKDANEMIVEVADENWTKFINLMADEEKVLHTKEVLE